MILIPEEPYDIDAGVRRRSIRRRQLGRLASIVVVAEGAKPRRGPRGAAVGRDRPVRPRPPGRHRRAAGRTRSRPAPGFETRVDGARPRPARRHPDRLRPGAGHPLRHRRHRRRARRRVRHDGGAAQRPRSSGCRCPRRSASPSWSTRRSTTAWPRCSSVDERMTALADSPDWFRRALAVPFTDERVEVDGAAHPLPGVGRARPARPGVRARRRRPRPLVDPRGRHVRRRVPGARHRPVGPRRQRAPRRLRRSSSGPTRSWPWPPTGGIDGPPGRDRPQHGRLRHHRHRGAATPTDVAGVIVCDSPVTEPDPEIGAYQLQGGLRRAAHLRDASTRRMARFRTVPPQDHYLDYVIDHVARRSLHAGRRRLAVEVRPPRLRAVRRAACAGVAAALPGAVDLPPRAAALGVRPRHRRHRRSPCTSSSAGSRPVIEIPEAGHHAMLDQPLILLTALRTPARRLGPLRPPPPLRARATAPRPGPSRASTG